MDNPIRKNPDSILFEGKMYYSDNYVELMMGRAKDQGIYEGQRKPVIHTCEHVFMPCHNCGYVAELSGFEQLEEKKGGEDGNS